MSDDRHEWTPPPGGGWNCGARIDGKPCNVIWSDRSVHFPNHPAQRRAKDTLTDPRTILAVVRDRHRYVPETDDDAHCNLCGFLWPCDAVRLLAALEAVLDLADDVGVVFEHEIRVTVADKLGGTE